MRIPPLEEPLDDEIGPVLRAMMPPGVPPIALFRTFGKNPGMTLAMREWGAYCLSRRLSVDMRTREIVIDRTTARCQCEYELGVHLAFFADRVALTPEQRRSLASGGADDPCWSPRERLVIRLVDDLHDTATVAQPLWDELAAEFTEAQLLDMLMLTGWYHAISFVANAAEVPLEKFFPAPPCRECGFVYDEAQAGEVPQLIGSGVADLVSLLASDLDLRSRRRPDLWSPLEYACHVRDMLLVQRERVLLARRTERPDCVPMGRDDRVDHDGYADQVPADVARQLTDAAALFGNVLSRLGDADWNRTVIYSWPEPEERSLRWVAVHSLHEVRHHLLDIRRQLALT